MGTKESNPAKHDARYRGSESKRDRNERRETPSPLGAEQEALIRRYLLRELSEQERQSTEERLFVDDDFFNLMLMVEADLVDEYTRGQLSQQEKERFESGFLSTAEGQREVNFAEALMYHASEATTLKQAQVADKISMLSFISRQAHLPSYLKAAAVLVVAVGLGLILWWSFIYESQLDKGLIALKKAFSEQRLIKSRVSGFNYAPETRGSDPVSLKSVDLLQARAILLNEAAESPGPESYHAVGKLYLAERNFDEAIKYLKAALEQRPHDARMHSDLGAALLDKGIDLLERREADSTEEQSGGSLRLIAESKEESSQALALDGSLLEALFNRALANYHLGLLQEAQADWRQYIEKDSDSGWEGEAKKYLELIEQKPVTAIEDREEIFQRFLQAYQVRDDKAAWEALCRSHDSGGSYIENRLLRAYLDSSTQGKDGQAKDSLNALSFAGELKAQKADDLYVRQQASFYRTAGYSRRVALRNAHDLTAQAFNYFNQSDTEKALELYKRAKDLFEEAGSSCDATFVQLRIAHCYIIQPDLAQGLSAIESILAHCKAKGYKWLLAQCLYQLATIKIGLKQYPEAIKDTSQALGLSEQSGDINSVLKSLVQLSEEFRYLNNPNKSLGFLKTGLYHADYFCADPMQKWMIQTAIALNCAFLGLYRTALDYHKQALRSAQGMNRPLTLCRSYEYLGLTYAKLRMLDEAVGSIERAFEIGRGIPSEKDSLNSVAHAYLQQGDIYKEAGDFRKAVDAYDQSITLYSKSNFQQYSYTAHKGKLLSYLAMSDDQAVRQEIEIVFNLFDEYWAKITRQGHRNTFFETEQEIYDLAIGFEFTKMNNAETAYEYSEKSRSRSFQDLMLKGVRVIKEPGLDLETSEISKPLTRSEIIEKMPEQEQILQYSLLNDKLLIWVVSKSGEIKSRSVVIDSRDLTEKVRSFKESVTSPSQSRSQAAVEAAKELHDLLIKPVEQFLDNKKRVRIIPDKVLYNVAFNALISSTTNEYFLEEFSSGLSSSASIFVRCSENARGKNAAREEVLLSVGDPAYDREAFRLPRLDAAAMEARTIKKAYVRSRCLVNDQARESAVKREMERSDIIHFALHHIADQRSPLLSKLLLAHEPAQTARQGAEDGILYSYEVYNMKLDQVRVVILSACETGIGPVIKGEGPISTARAFIASGVPVVIASLWLVDSNPTAELMKRFHTYRKLGKDTTEALRQAQLEFLKEKDSLHSQPYYWASFFSFGGHSAF